MKKLVFFILFLVRVPSEPPRYPDVSYEQTAQWTAWQVGPVIRVVAEDFELNAERRDDGVLIHWFFDGQYAWTENVMP